MKKFLIYSVIFGCISSQVFGTPAPKKLKDKEFVIKKQRNDNFENVQKPKYVAYDLFNQDSGPQDIKIKDLEHDIELLPLSFDLKNKIVPQIIKNSFIRFGLGLANQPNNIYFVSLSDLLLKYDFKDFTTHFIHRTRTPYYPGWIHDFQFYIDYAANDVCKPFLVLDYGYKSFHFKDFKGNTNHDISLTLGAPIICDKGTYISTIDFRRSSFNLEKEEPNSKDNLIEYELNAKFNSSNEIDEDQHLLFDIYWTCLGYRGTELNDNTLWINDKKNVNIIHLEPKYSLKFKQITLSPKISFDFCTNESFFSESPKIFPGCDIEYQINRNIDLIFKCCNNLKLNRFKDLYNKNQWIQIARPTKVLQYRNFSIESNLKFSMFRLNAKIAYNKYDNYRILLNSKDSSHESVNKTKHHPVFLPKYEDVNRIKESIAIYLDLLPFTALIKGTAYQYWIKEKEPVPNEPVLNLKSDIYYNIVDKLLCHVNAKILYGMKSKSDINKSLPTIINLGAGIDYIYSDAFMFFINIDNILKDSLKRYYGIPDGALKITIGVGLTPDSLLNKNIEE